MKVTKNHVMRLASMAMAAVCTLSVTISAAAESSAPSLLDKVISQQTETAEPAKTAETSEAPAPAAEKPAEKPSTKSGTVTGGTINIRSGPSTNTDCVTQVQTGKTMTILEKSGDWYHVSFDGSEGYIYGEYLLEEGVTKNVSAASTASTNNQKQLNITGTVIGGTVNVRSGPSTNTDKVSSVSTGKYVKLLNKDGDWYHISVDGKDGYIYGEYVMEGEHPEVAAEAAPAASGIGASVAANAKKYLGVRYVYGGASPSGFDCSGLTMYLYRQFGYSLPHSASAQSRCGHRVSRSELQPGDLVFFSNSGHNGRITHVGVYVGNGQVVHARLSVGRVYTNSLSESYYNRNFVCACRIA